MADNSPDNTVLTGEPDPITDENLHVPVVGFFQQRWVQEYMPFVVSFIFHAVLIVLGILFAQTVVQIITPTIEQVVVPDASLADGDVGGVPNPGINNDPTRQAMQNTDSSVQESDDWANKRSESLSAAASDSPATTAGAAIGTGFSASSGASSGLQGKSDGGGKMAKFGPPGGGGGGLTKGLGLGTGGNATAITYLCDFSGSMMGRRSALLIRELRDVVSRLSVKQSFNVVFFREEDGRDFSALDDNRLVPAISKNKDDLYKFLDDTRPAGATRPLEGIERAFKMNPRPQIIYILSDGFEAIEDPQQVKLLIDRLNKDKKTRIHTIMFRDAEADWNLPQIKTLDTMMSEIARENGGTFKRVSADKL